MAADAGPVELTLLGPYGEESSGSFMPRFAAIDSALLHQAALTSIGMTLSTGAVSLSGLAELRSVDPGPARLVFIGEDRPSRVHLETGTASSDTSADRLSRSRIA